MGITEIIGMVGSVGFPVVACVCMGWFVKYQTDQNKAEISKIASEHKEEMLNVTTALNNNTLALQKLCDKLGGDVDNE